MNADILSSLGGFITSETKLIPFKLKRAKKKSQNFWNFIHQTSSKVLSVINSNWGYRISIGRCIWAECGNTILSIIKKVIFWFVRFICDCQLSQINQIDLLKQFIQAIHLFNRKSIVSPGEGPCVEPVILLEKGKKRRNRTSLRKENLLKGKMNGYTILSTLIHLWCLFFIFICISWINSEPFFVEKKRSMCDVWFSPP